MYPVERARPWLLAFGLLAWGAPAAAAEDLRISLISAGEEAVLYQAGLLDRPLAHILEALDSGVPSRVLFIVELWRVRSRWFDRLEWSVTDEFVVNHDPLLDEYEVRRDVPVWRSFAGREDLAAWLAAPGSRELRPPNGLRAGANYFLAAEVRIEPFTRERVGEVERWLSGGEMSGGGLDDYLVGWVVRMSGLGDLTIGGRSDPFQPGPE